MISYMKGPTYETRGTLWIHRWAVSNHPKRNETGQDMPDSSKNNQKSMFGLQATILAVLAKKFQYSKDRGLTVFPLLHHIWRNQFLTNRTLFGKDRT